MNIQDWYSPLAQLQSKGSTVERPGSLAGLARARAQHQGQFFTGNDLARLVWRIVEPAMDQAIQGTGMPVAILDNAVGSGRLLQFADPDRYVLGGMDVDERCISALQSASEAAGFDAQFVCAGMQACAPRQYGVALINPPFSVHLDAPSLQPLGCTHWGRYGPNSASISHAYALAQALKAADIVVAILPRNYADEVFSSVPLEGKGRLRAIIDTPAQSFIEESTAVATSLAVFGPPSPGIKPARLALSSLDEVLPEFGLSCNSTASYMNPRLGLVDDATESQTIPGEVTGDVGVRVVHDGRRIGLKFRCALVHARVMNAILKGPVAPIENHRYPKGVRYIGQGRLDVEVYLLQPDPVAAFEAFLDDIRAAGGEPDVDPGLRGYLARKIRRYQRESTPFGHVVKGGLVTGHAELVATVARARMLNPLRWGSKLLRAGDVLSLVPEASGGYRVEVDGESHVLQEDELARDFKLEQASATGWREAHPSREGVFPELARMLRAHLAHTGADQVASWDYQLEDLVELLMGRHGVAPWRMGCGKTRLLLALCLAGGRHNGICLESHLVEETVDQIREIGLPDEMWQVITRPEQCRDLMRINIISYTRLRMPLSSGGGRRTYARELRRRFSMVGADEAHLLRNTDTEQSRALAMLSPRRRFAVTATLIASYVQNMLPVLQWAYGDGTAIQPFGRHHPHIEPRFIESMSAAQRGVDRFVEDHTVFEWVTRAFEDGLQKGAKRQVPKVRNVERLRTVVAPLIKRRHESEPAVSRYFKVPDPRILVTPVEWDEPHLAHYLKVADLFADWYRKAREKADSAGSSINLITLLARIGAVQRACNFPQHIPGEDVIFSAPPYLPLTSKQRMAIERLCQWTDEGHKTVCFTDSPGQVELLARHVEERGVEVVRFHGGIPIKERTAAMNRRFRYGPAPVMIANGKVTQNGLNIWQADRALMVNRFWTDTEEEQAYRRLLRPQQTRDVLVEFLQLKGSIDYYQAQMTGMKGETADSVIDFITPEYEDVEFVHMDMILNAFVSDLAGLRGMEPHQLRELYHAA